MNQFTNVSQLLIRASSGDRLVNVVSISYHIDPFTPIFTIQAVDMDTNAVYFVDQGVAPGLVGADRTLLWPINDPLATQLTMPNRTLRLQLQMVVTFYNFTTATVATYNLIPIMLVPPMTITVALPTGQPATNAVVTLTPKDPQLAFGASRVSYTYNTDVNGQATVTMTGGVQSLQARGALITVYIPQSNYFAYVDNAQLGGGIAYNMVLNLMDPNNPPVFRVKVTSQSAITASLAQLLGLIGTPTGFTRVGSQISGNDFIMDVTPNTMSPTFGWGPFLLSVVTIGVVIIVILALTGWTFQQIAGVGATPGGQVFLAGLGIAVAGGVLYFLLSPTFRGRVSSAYSSGRRRLGH